MISHINRKSKVKNKRGSLCKSNYSGAVKFKARDKKRRVAEEQAVHEDALERMGYNK